MADRTEGQGDHDKLDHDWLSDVHSVYMDYNATTPLADEVIVSINEAMKEAWGNPSSTYPQGLLAKKLITESRARVAEMIDANQEDIIFTSGGTESNNLVIHSVVEAYKWLRRTTIGQHNQPIEEQDKRPHIISSNQEHDSVALVLRHLEQCGDIDVTYVPASHVTGRVSVEDVIGAIRHTTCLISVMLANNETGIIQPIRELGQRLAANRKSGQGSQRIYLHTDAAQCIGKVLVSVQELGVDFLTVVGHKFYGPRVGALYVRDPNADTPLYPMFHGGGQERSMRPGTENTPMIVGLGKACELVQKNVLQYEATMRATRDYLEQQLEKTFGSDAVHFNGRFEGVERLPNTCNVSLLGSGLKGCAVLSHCKLVHASVGAACHSGTKPSAILLSIGIPECIASNAIRLSVGKETSREDVDIVVEDLLRVVGTLRGDLIPGRPT